METDRQPRESGRETLTRRLHRDARRLTARPAPDLAPRVRAALAERAPRAPSRRPTPPPRRRPGARSGPTLALATVLGVVLLLLALALHRSPVPGGGRELPSAPAAAVTAGPGGQAVGRLIRRARAWQPPPLQTLLDQPLLEQAHQLAADAGSSAARLVGRMADPLQKLLRLGAAVARGG